MSLSPNAAKALDQVKMGLFMLYGADYFTQDEWFKIDFLIHKGKYVLTSGPPRNILPEEELISFGESKDDIEAVNVQANSIQSNDEPKKDGVVVSEEQLPSPNSSEGADSHINPDETPNATSMEPSSDEEPPLTASKADASTLLDFSEHTTPAEPPPKIVSPRQTSNSLPPGITQQQLDEARAMQAAMTKAGQKTRPKYNLDEQLAASRWADDVPEDLTVDAYPSPAPSERDSRISTWATEVNAQQSSSSSERASPAPVMQPVDPKVLAEQEFIRVHGRKPKALADYWQPKNPVHFSQQTISPESISQAGDAKAIAEEEYVRIHGRKPKSVNDFYQPNNPNHFSHRPVSRASDSTAKTTKTTNTIPVGPKADLKINLGSTYIAQSAQPKSSFIKLELRAGDHIKVLRFVSGIMWLGLNARTNLTGQFSEDIFRKVADTPKPEPKSVQTAAAASTMTSFSIRNGLENVEWTNAAEWDEIPAKSLARISQAAPAPLRPALGGLASSRFSVLADREESKAQVPAQDSITLAMKKEFGKMVDEKVDEILKARGMAPTPLPTGPRSKALNEPLKPVPPKKNTCWFWATNKGCRFTAEECRDLHGYLPATSEPTNLHMGRPTWGALADASPAVGHADPDSFTVPEVDPSSRVSAEQKRNMTCWYWANNGKCDYSAESCKYKHEHTANGVATRPWKPRPSWVAPTWRQEKDGESVINDATVNFGGTVAGDENEDGNSGNLVLEEVNADTVARWGVIGDGGAGGWGRDTPIEVSSSGWGQEDRYKPPHIKALEEKAMIEAVGW